ncbi:cytochrome c-type biogenesis protein CcmH [Aestuariivirga sp.]|uniref:cytochrome c-type biogenesis protein n=1 Tax=Aestuariivirga sp. TaxID=2650926 RepID=UPI0035943092
MRKFLTMLALLACLGPAYALSPDEILKDEALEQRARGLSAHLRCLVCQNQSIDDSDAPLAKDLRTLIREQLVAGKTDEQIMDFVVARYGEYVLLKPRLGAGTIVLWGTPFAVLLIAGTLLLLRRKNIAPAPEAPLTEAEHQALQRALE